MQTSLTKVGQNTAILFIVKVVGFATAFVMAGILGRGLGDTGFGQYSFVLAWLGSFVPLSEFGLNTVLIRTIAGNPDKTDSTVVNVLVAKAILSLPAFLALLFLAQRLAPNAEAGVVFGLRWGVIWLTSGFISTTLSSLFMAQQRAMPVLWLTVVGQLLRVGGTWLLLNNGATLPALVLWLGVSRVGEMGVSLLFYRGQWRGLVAWVNIKALIIEAFPFAIAGILATVQLRMNTLLLGYWGGDQALGWFAAADRLFDAARELPGAVFGAILPAFSALIAQNDTHKLQQTLTTARWWLLAFGVVTGVVTLFAGRWVLLLVYGEAFLPALPALIILMLSVTATSQSNLFIMYLYALGSENLVNGVRLVAILFNGLLGWWLIPQWGAGGAAMGMLLSQIATLLLLLPQSRRINLIAR